MQWTPRHETSGVYGWVRLVRTQDWGDLITMVAVQARAGSIPCAFLFDFFLLGGQSSRVACSESGGS